MKPVSIAWSGPPGSGTVTVWLWPPIRAAASKTVIAWSRWRWWAATSPETPVPTIAIFIGQALRSGSWIGRIGTCVPDVQKLLRAPLRSTVRPVKELVAQELADGLEPVPATAQGVDDLGER